MSGTTLSLSLIYAWERKKRGRREEEEREKRKTEGERGDKEGRKEEQKARLSGLRTGSQWLHCTFLLLIVSCQFSGQSRGFTLLIIAPARATKYVQQQTTRPTGYVPSWDATHHESDYTCSMSVHTASGYVHGKVSCIICTTWWFRALSSPVRPPTHIHSLQDSISQDRIGRCTITAQTVPNTEKTQTGWTSLIQW